MKTFSVIAKVVAALAAVAGIVYVVATYGDKIVAWAKKLMSCCDYCKDCDCNCDGECTCEDDCACCDCECECDDDCQCKCQCECEEADEEVEAPAADEVVAAEADFEG